MKTRPSRILWSALCAVVFCLSAGLISARLIDDFNDNTKTGWTDFKFPLPVPYSTITEANGQFKFTLIPVGQSIFSASTKSAQTYHVQDGRTVEFRVDLASGNGPDAFAVLGWFPGAAQVGSLSGYGLAKSSTDILITKGINKYFYDEPIVAKNTNVTLVLSLTGRGTSVIIHAEVLDKDNNDAVLWQQTVVDTEAADILRTGTDDPPAPYRGDGNVALICYEDQGTTQPSYEVTFDNLEVFVLDRTVLDNFDDNVKTSWEDFSFAPPAGIAVETGGQFRFTWPPAGQSIFSASTKTSRTFDLLNEERILLSVDLVYGIGADSFAVLGWFPVGSHPSTLSGYGLAKSSTDILITKGINKYFYNENVSPPVKNTNVTLVLTLEGRGTSVIINGKVLDKDDNDAVLWERTVVDTEAADILADGTDSPPAPYTGSGRYALFCYEDDGRTQPFYEVVYDNAEVLAAPPPANVAPVISDVLPQPYANFLPATNRLSFKVTDDRPLVNAGITVTLNGKLITSANGLSITGTGASRNVSLGGLSNNVNYVAVMQVVDADNATNSATLYFDTFAANSLVVEMEDYNFGSGQFINNPILVPEGAGPEPDGYRGQAGIPEIDYHDSRTSFPNAPYRVSDAVGMQRTLDLPRQKFVDAGGGAQGFYDYDVGQIATGDWLNFTRDFPAGSYEIYLRESLVNQAQCECILERVVTSPSQPDQFTEVVGAFLGTATGFRYRNVPLTDASGQSKIVVSLSGEQTLRLRQVTPDPADGSIYQNYLVFIPAAGSAILRPIVTSLSPAPNSVTETIRPTIEANIRNRETTLNTESIVLELNGQRVTPELGGDFDNTLITYAISPLPASGALNTARLVFADDQGVAQTNLWSFTITYKHLNPANRRPAPGSEPGFLLRMVQAPAGSNLENNLSRAESQLAPNSPIPAVVDTNTLVPVVNFTQNAPPASQTPYFDNDISVPGLYDDTGASLGNGTDDFSVEALAYLDLAAGVYRFGFRSDDGYKITSGSSLRDLLAPPLGGRNGVADETFDFIVSEPGLYPFRMVWYERGGGAYAEWFSVDPVTQEKTLINDPNAPHSIKAYTVAPEPIFVESAAQLTGPYATVSSASIDAAARTITVPLDGNVRFYRLRSERALRITSIRIVGGNVMLRYE